MNTHGEREREPESSVYRESDLLRTFLGTFVFSDARETNCAKALHAHWRPCTVPLDQGDGLGDGMTHSLTKNPLQISNRARSFRRAQVSAALSINWQCN
jgi:hypothetical protein